MFGVSTWRLDVPGALCTLLSHLPCSLITNEIKENRLTVVPFCQHFHVIVLFICLLGDTCLPTHQSVSPMERFQGSSGLTLSSCCFDYTLPCSPSLASMFTSFIWTAHTSTTYSVHQCWPDICLATKGSLCPSFIFSLHTRGVLHGVAISNYRCRT